MPMICYKIHNLYGISDVRVLVKDKKDGMKIVFDKVVSKNGSEDCCSSTGSGSHAEVEIKVDQGVPYGKPWISPGENVTV